MSSLRDYAAPERQNCQETIFIFSNRGNGFASGTHRPVLQPKFQALLKHYPQMRLQNRVSQHLLCRQQPLRRHQTVLRLASSSIARDIPHNSCLLFAFPFFFGVDFFLVIKVTA